MGVYYTSYALIGYKIDAPHLVTTHEEPNCEHQDRIGPDERHCPVCGKAKGMKRVHEWGRWHALTELLSNRIRPPFVWTLSDESNMFIYIGVGTYSDHDTQERVLTEIWSQDEIAKALKALLMSADFRSFGLWNEDRPLGFYSITHGS